MRVDVNTFAWACHLQIQSDLSAAALGVTEVARTVCRVGRGSLSNSWSEDGSDREQRRMHTGWRRWLMQSAECGEMRCAILELLVARG